MTLTLWLPWLTLGLESVLDFSCFWPYLNSSFLLLLDNMIVSWIVSSAKKTCITISSFKLLSGKIIEVFTTYLNEEQYNSAHQRNSRVFPQKSCDLEFKEELDLLLITYLCKLIYIYSMNNTIFISLLPKDVVSSCLHVSTPHIILKPVWLKAEVT